MTELLKHVNHRIDFFKNNKKFRDDAEGCLIELRAIKKLITKAIKSGEECA